MQMTPSTLNQLQVLLKNQLPLFVAFHASLLSLFFFFPFFFLNIHLSICSSFIAQIFPPSLRFQHYLPLRLPCPLADLPLPTRRRSAGKGSAGARRRDPGARGWGGWGKGSACWQPCEQPAGRCPAPKTSRRDPPPLPPSTHPPLATAGSPPPIAVHQLRIPATLT